MIQINKKIIFDYKKAPIIIAEISGNHGGNKKKFLKLIDKAFSNGADLVKIQTYEAKDITLNKKIKKFTIKTGIWKNYNLWDHYNKACTPFEWHYDAFRIAKKHKKILFSSPFSTRAVDFLESFNVPLYKISSFEITDLKLIKYIASKKKPIIISTGMASYKEIDIAINTIKKYHKKIIILHCVSNYPTNLQDTNLNKIHFLKKRYKNYLIGMSDHTKNLYSSIAGISLDIVAVEKHFKLDHKSNTTDSKFSITPDELYKLREIYNKLSKSLFKNTNTNQKHSKRLRRSIYSIQNIKRGEKFTKENIDTLRPNTGMTADKYFKVLGKKSKRNILSGTSIKKIHIY